MYVRVTAFIFLSIVCPILCHEEIDRRNDAILENFKMDPNHVLRYKRVEVHLPERLHKRDLGEITHVEFQTFDDDDYMNLWLVPADTIFASDETPVWLEDSTSTSYDYRVSYKIKQDAMKNLGILLEDRDHMASLVIGSDASGSTTVNGVLRSRNNTRLVIRSLPEDVVHGDSRGRRSSDERSGDATNRSRHVLFELSDGGTENYGLRDYLGRQSRLNPEYLNRQQPGAPYANKKIAHIIYPRLLIQVDSSYPKLQSSEDLTHFLEYLLAYWNSVNMIFGKIDYPKFRLNIAGFVIAENSEATPFIMDHMMKKDVLDVDPAIAQLRQFYFNAEMQLMFPLDSYEILVAMSTFKMSNKYDQYIVGVVEPGHLCESQTDRISNAVILRDDGGSFRTALNAAHELGHVFGLSHDESYEDPRCAAHHGFLMASGVSSTGNAEKFSTCSLKSLRDFYDDGKFSCMQNVPEHGGNRLSIPLPGQTKSLDEQCVALGFARLCNWGDRDVCDSISCMRADGNSCTSTPGVGAAPGSPCGGKNNPLSKICVDNRCVAAH